MLLGGKPVSSQTRRNACHVAWRARCVCAAAPPQSTLQSRHPSDHRMAPSLSQQQVRAYLQRIKFPLHPDKLPEPTYDTLALCQSLHQRHVPFDNLSMLIPQWRELDMSSEGVKLDVPSLYHKVVESGRGGYCFELNLLYAALLEGLGFTVYAGTAKLPRERPQFDPHAAPDSTFVVDSHKHCCLCVRGGLLPPGQTFMSDVGIATITLSHPLLVPSQEELQGLNDTLADPPAHPDIIPQFRLRWGKGGSMAAARPGDPEQGYHLQVWMKNDMTCATGWHDFFFFEPPSTFKAEDLSTANHWQSTSPQSVLLKGPICGRPLECGGHMFILFNKLRQRDISGDMRVLEEANTPEELSRMLLTHFNIVLPPAASQPPAQ